MAARENAREVALLRIAAQRLAGPGLCSAVETVRWLTAMQAQEIPGVVASVALRTSDSRGQSGVEAVRTALDDGSLLRS